jgi:transposase
MVTADKEVGMAFSLEFRIAVVNAHAACGSSQEVAEQFGCCESWVRRMTQRLRELGTLEAKSPQRPDNRALDEEDERRLKKLIEKTPDMTLEELAAALDGKASVATVWRTTKRLKLTLKKRRSTPPSRTART